MREILVQFDQKCVSNFSYKKSGTEDNFRELDGFNLSAFIG